MTDLVVDANVVMAALIKDGIAAELLLEPELRLFGPEFLFHEIEKHEEELSRKTARSEEEFAEMLSILAERITIVPLEEFKPFLEEANSISPDDFVYFALALKLKAAIWSNDKRLKDQKRVAVYSTADIAVPLIK